MFLLKEVPWIDVDERFWKTATSVGKRYEVPTPVNICKSTQYIQLRLTTTIPSKEFDNIICTLLKVYLLIYHNVF